MTAFQATASIASYFVYQLGALLLWPSRKNVVAWLALPLFITAYIIPVLTLNYESRAVESLVLVNGVGAIAMVIGLLLGHVWWRNGRRTPVMSIRVLRHAAPQSRDIVEQRVMLALLLSNVTMTLCFAWLGGFPIFADDVFLAKFFRGDYKVKYDQISIFYRLAQTILITLMPVAVALAANLRSRRLIIYIVWSMALFAGALNRGLVLSGIVIVVAVWSTATRARWLAFLVASVLLVVLGSVIFSVLGLFGEREFSIFQEIAYGAPDVSDQVGFLEAFEASNPFTYGLTFIGGLIPGNFFYNPSVFTLAIPAGTEDISEIGSGGLRLSPALYGYIAFSWAGAVLVPLLSGLLQAPFIERLKKAFGGDLVDKTIGVQSYIVIGSLFYSFYALSYQGVISVFVLAWALRSRARRRGAVHTKHVPA